MFEKVNPSHPDKIADRIAGAIVDLAYEREKNPRISAFRSSIVLKGIIISLTSNLLISKYKSISLLGINGSPTQSEHWTHCSCTLHPLTSLR